MSNVKANITAHISQEQPEQKLVYHNFVLEFHFVCRFLDTGIQFSDAFMVWFFAL